MGRPIAVDLFCGAGGFSLGFEQAGFNVLAGVEIDEIHAATHKYNFPFCEVLCKDIIETTGEEIRKVSSIGNQEIDVVFGSPPCQAFSIIGKREKGDTRNQLVFEFVRLVVELQPKFFVFENVKGLISGDHINFVYEIIKQFKENSYQMRRNFKILNSVNFKVPQNRERLFLFGSRKDQTLLKYPISKTSSPHSKNHLQLPSTPTVWQAIQDLPEIEEYPELKKQDWAIAKFGKPSEYVKNLNEHKTNFSMERIFDSGVVTASLRTNHNHTTMKRFANTPHGQNEPISWFFKLDPDGVCNTLRAGSTSQRGSFTAPRPIHPFKPRCITVREAARLHSYPDSFGFHPTIQKGFMQIGNSVCPLVAQAIATEIINHMNITPTKPTISYIMGSSIL